VTQPPADAEVIQAWKAHRPYLVDLAFRMLGDIGAAEDAVQEAFARLLQAGPRVVEDPRGWLIVVTSRLCLDQIKSAHSRRERAEDASVLDARQPNPTSVDPLDRVTLDDSVRLALVVVLEQLTPAERVVFVLHDIFQVPFDIVADTVGKSAATCRQLAHRARQKVENSRGSEPAPADLARHQDVAEKFIAACTSGSFDGLLAVLAPDASGEVDIREGVVVVGAAWVASGILHYWSDPGTTIVSQFAGGQPALLAFSGRELTGILLLDIEAGLIQTVHVLVDPAKLDLVRSQLAD
jgi:RNA polymerase sigma-70 factor (ECF subfamily)